MQFHLFIWMTSGRLVSSPWWAGTFKIPTIWRRHSLRCRREVGVRHLEFVGFSSLTSSIFNTVIYSQWISSRWACSNLLLMSSLHQIGLAIGLNPSRDKESVMFPLYRSDLPVKSLTLYEGTLILMIFFCSHTAPRVELGSDDTVGLQKIYGPKKKPTSTEIWVWEKTTESCVFGNILTRCYFLLHQKKLKVLYFMKNTEDDKILISFEFKTNWKFCSTSRETYGQNDRAISKERRF